MILTWTVYILSFAVWAADIRILWQELFVLIPQRMSDVPPSDTVDAALSKINGPAALTQICCWYIVVRRLLRSKNQAYRYSKLLIGDGIVLWRAYAIWGRPRWLRLASCFIILVDFGAYGCTLQC
jgi:hypothetical protein